VSGKRLAFGPRLALRDDLEAAGRNNVWETFKLQSNGAAHGGAVARNVVISRRSESSERGCGKVEGQAS
jgi:hypothetical protein